jgi:hypothetical protein
MGLPAVLLFGTAFGMLHALEADHLAAVAALAARDGTLRGTVRQGVAWGAGHALTLLAFGGAVLLLGAVIDTRTAAVLEATVGAMLVALGADLLRRLLRERSAQVSAPRMPMRAVAVGMMHGLAGSAALVLLALEQVGSPLVGGIYILMFGLGSIAGMATLSVAIALPLRLTAARLAVLNRVLQAAIATFSVGLGLQLLYRNLA